MGQKIEGINVLGAKKLEDADLNTIVGGAGENDLPQYQRGDIVYVVVNQTSGSGTGLVKGIALKCRIISEPYRNVMNFWSYTVLILAQDPQHEGYENLVGIIHPNITEGVIAVAASYMAENGIIF